MIPPKYQGPGRQNLIKVFFLSHLTISRAGLYDTLMSHTPQHLQRLFDWGKNPMKSLTLIAYWPYTLVGSLEENPLAVKLLDNNRLYIITLPLYSWGTRLRGINI